MPKLSQKQIICIIGTSILAAAGLVCFLIWRLSPQSGKQVGSNTDSIKNTKISKGSNKENTIKPNKKKPVRTLLVPNKFEDCQKELACLLEEKETNESELEEFFTATKEKFNLSESPPAIAKKHFEERKQEILAPTRILSKWDLEVLENTQAHIKKLDPNYQVKDFTQELKELHGKRYIEAFNKLEANPEVSEAVELAKTAESAFTSAKLVCGKEPKVSPLHHESFESESCVGYLNDKINTLLKDGSQDALKYIKTLRNFRPSADLAFPGATSLDDIKQRYADGNNRFVIPHGRTIQGVLIETRQNIDEVLGLGLRELDSLILETTTAGESPSSFQDHYRWGMNLQFLRLARSVKENDSKELLAWAETGFRYHNCDEFAAWIASRPTPELIRRIISTSYDYFYHAWRYYVISNIGWRIPKAQLEDCLSNYASMHVDSLFMTNHPNSAILLRLCRVNDQSSLDEVVGSISHVPLLNGSFCKHFKEIGNSTEKCSPEIQLYRDMYKTLCKS